jgi:hypothetical protein
MTNTAEIIISTYGNGIAVGLKGTKEQIEREFNRFFNWGAAAANVSFMRSNEDSEMQHGELGDSYLHEIGKNFSYFLSTHEAMVKAITAETMTTWQDSPISKQYKTQRNGKKQSGKVFVDHATIAAKDEYNSYTRENFMLFGKTPTHIYQQLDGGAPSWIKETED